MQSYNYIENIEIFEKHFSDSQLGDIQKRNPATQKKLRS